VSVAARPRIIWPIIALLMTIMVVFVAIRLATDVPNVALGRVPADEYPKHYALHPVPAYLHILPAAIYLLGAPFQLSRRFREGHWTLHPRLGRVLLTAGLISGVFAVVFGVLYSFGGWVQASASALFGGYFVAALTVAFLAIRRGDVTHHRRWMIRAFAVGLAVGTIRIWIGFFQATGLLAFDTSFGLAFWISFTLHVLVAELYLRRRPAAEGAAPVPVPAH
jgi:uncharacterized membrane protein